MGHHREEVQWFKIKNNFLPPKALPSLYLFLKKFLGTIFGFAMNQKVH